jgi:hypothetical protein
VTGKLKEELKTLALSAAGHSLGLARLLPRGIELSSTVFKGKTGAFSFESSDRGQRAPDFFPQLD